MVDYKKTSKYEESKTPLTVQNPKSQDYFQGKEKGFKMPTVHYSKSHSSKCGVEGQKRDNMAKLYKGYHMVILGKQRFYHIVMLIVFQTIKNQTKGEGVGNEQKYFTKAIRG